MVIACDTDVVLDGEVLGKPADADEARRYLERMSGALTQVLSGLVVSRDGEERSGLERTTVVFKELDRGREASATCDFGEWQGRSGGYAIQTLGSTWSSGSRAASPTSSACRSGCSLELAPELAWQAAADRLRRISAQFAMIRRLEIVRSHRWA